MEEWWSRSEPRSAVPCVIANDDKWRDASDASWLVIRTWRDLQFNFGSFEKQKNLLVIIQRKGNRKILKRSRNTQWLIDVSNILRYLLFLYIRFEFIDDRVQMNALFWRKGLVFYRNRRKVSFIATIRHVIRFLFCWSK